MRINPKYKRFNRFIISVLMLVIFSFSPVSASPNLATHGDLGASAGISGACPFKAFYCFASHDKRNLVEDNTAGTNPHNTDDNGNTCHPTICSGAIVPGNQNSQYPRYLREYFPLLVKTLASGEWAVPHRPPYS